MENETKYTLISYKKIVSSITQQETIIEPTTCNCCNKCCLYIHSDCPVVRNYLGECNECGICKNQMCNDCVDTIDKYMGSFCKLCFDGGQMRDTIRDALMEEVK